MIGANRPPCDEGLIRAAAPATAGLSPARKRGVLAATILGSSLAFIDGSVVTVALPAMQQALGADSAAAQWIVNSYLLFLGALVLVGGGLADRFGRRRVFVIGVAVFAAASIACAVSPNAAALIAARALQGIGAALLTPASLAILGAVFDDHERGQAIGAWAGIGALTVAAGPVLGGWLVDTLSWRAIFFINVPLALAAILLAIKTVPESRDEQAGRIDWPGAMLAASGLGAVVWALTAMPARGGADLAVVAALAGGAALLAAFVAVEARRPDAMMPLRLFQSRAFAGANLLTFLLYFALGAMLFYLPFALIRLGGYSATGAGAALLPFALIMGLGSAFAGRIADQLGARPLLIGGPWIAAMGFAVLGFAQPRPYWAGVLPGMIVLALGMTFTVAPLTATVMSAVDRRHAGLASGINNAVARIAGLFAVAALGALLFWRFAAALPADDPSAAREALNAVMIGGAARIDGAERAFAAAFRAVMLTCAGCAAAAGAVAAATIPGKLHAQHQEDYDG